MNKKYIIMKTVLQKIKKSTLVLFGLLLTAGFANAQCDSTFTYSGDSTNISFSPTDIYASSYFWDFGDGSTSTDVSPNYTYADTGSYTVCVEIITYVQGQLDTCSSCENIVVSYPTNGGGGNPNVSVVEQNLLSFKAYPNPFIENLTISINNTANSKLTIQLIDLSGKIITSEKTNESTLKINTFGLEKGIYFIRVTTSTGITTSKKIVKQ